MTSTQPLTSENKLYVAHDRIVCGRLHCAGASVVYTGQTIGGANVRPFTETDAAEHLAAGFEPCCECGAVSAVEDAASTHHPAPQHEHLTPTQDRFVDGYAAAKRHYGPGAADALAAIHAAAQAVRDECPTGPEFYTSLLDLIDSRAREWRDA